MPLLLTTLIFLGTGLAIGFISGLLGIGGGIVMSPVQYSFYTSNGIGADIATKMAFATSLAVILPTAASGVWRHHQMRSINWKVVFFMGSITFICSFIGAWVASRNISGAALRTGFGLVGLIIGIRMLTVKITDTDRPTLQNRWLWLAIALPVGIITGILGIGGGVIVIPLLVMVLRFRLRDAAATSLGIMLFSSAGGTLGWAITGSQAVNLPDHTLGYIYWPAWLGLSITSIVMAQAGAIMAHKLPGKQLNYIFLVLIFSISLYMLGVFNWIINRF